nr:ATP-binding protein [Actinomycetota bacterium]
RPRALRRTAPRERRPATRAALGTLSALVGEGALSAAMVPIRPHLSVATSALVLVVPVVLGVAVGGFVSGVVAVATGFLAYDLLFIPPYGTLSVGSSENWLALVVYALVMLIVARIVSSLREARADARVREAQARRLLELSEALMADASPSELLSVVAATTRRAFGLRSVAILLSGDEEEHVHGSAGGGEDGSGRGPGRALELVASAGEPLSGDDLDAVAPAAGGTRRVGGAAPGTEGLAWYALRSSGRAIGLLVVAGEVPDERDRELLRAYVNQAASALERAELREHAVDAKLLGEADRWRQALLGAVSHDLRTPLATVKAALEELRRADPALGRPERDELLELAESQADRLERLVANLLDMTQIQAGALRPRRAATTLDELVSETLSVLGPSRQGRVALSLPLTLPEVDVDHLLVVQVLANLLENAMRHAPAGSPIVVRARPAGELVEVAVDDRGPGVPAGERERIFAMFNRVSGGGRAGLGLAIARAFVEAHGGTIRAEERAGGGASFVFTLPAVRSGR